ncbi:hypothetical protein [Streptomyces sp. NPDC059874]|uniref:hypothetical protein n=1 Tax=Streptomyces sp. NPDC059874 TaxID=3346983 RepID=UPI00364CED2B
MDYFPGGVRMYNPVTGAGSPLAPPMHVTPVAGGVTGRFRLGIAHEGPPGYGHGGISAMLLDELMGLGMRRRRQTGHDHMKGADRGRSDPMREETDVGPLATEAGRRDLEALVDEAVGHGATVCIGVVRAGTSWM